MNECACVGKKKRERVRQRVDEWLCLRMCGEEKKECVCMCVCARVCACDLDALERRRVRLFVAACCSVLQCVAAVSCNVCACVFGELEPCTLSVLQCVAVCCSVLQCVAVYCSVFQCAAMCCIMLQCAAVCYSVL